MPPILASIFDWRLRFIPPGLTFNPFGKTEKDPEKEYEQLNIGGLQRLDMLDREIRKLRSTSAEIVCGIDLPSSIRRKFPHPRPNNGGDDDCLIRAAKR